jgi:hypothetical protein
MPKYPFEASFGEIQSDAEGYVDAVFSCLESEFLIMPKGVGFVAYPAFERGYEALKAATKGFSELEPAKVLPAALAEPISIVVLRTMLGFTPPEWGYVTTQRTGVSVTQGFARSLDRKGKDVAGNAAQRQRSYHGKAEGVSGDGLPDARRRRAPS